MLSFRVSLASLLFLISMFVYPSMSFAQPDLSVLEFSSPEKVRLGQNVADHVRMSIQNQGDQEASGFSIGIYLSDDETITSDDRLLEGGHLEISGLDNAVTLQINFSAEMRIPEDIETGAYFLGALIDNLNQIEERNEDNNSWAANIEVSRGLPNLSVSLFNAPKSCYQGQHIGSSLQLSIQNNGQADAGSFTVGVYLSPDISIESYDDLLVNGRKTIFSLKAGASVQVPFDSSAAVPAGTQLGNQYIGVLVDDQEYINEQFESDNDSSHTTMIYGPDLAFSRFECDRYSAGTGQAIGTQFKATIINQGQADIQHSFSAGIYLSKDASISSADTLLTNGHFSIPPLLSGYSVEVSIPLNLSIPSGVSPGQYYLGIMVDSGYDVIEDNEKNNVQAQAFAVTTDKWTIMGYFDGDCNREVQALGNLGQMEQANQAGVPVNLVALVDRHPNPGPTGGYSNVKVPLNGSDWSDTRWGPVYYDGNQNSFATNMSPLKSGQPELNMADDATLIDFIEEMMYVAPAEHYGLIIYDHGNMGGIAQDDTSNDSGISIPELRAALDAVPYIDIVLLDACLMQEIEVASEFIGEVGYLQASQAERGGTSLGSYTNINSSLQWLITNPSAAPSAFVKQLFSDDRHDVKFAAQQGDVSVLDMQEVPELNQRIDSFASMAVQSASVSELISLQNARSGVEAFSPWKSYLDIRQYMAGVAGNASISSQLRAEAQAIVNQVDQVVVHEKGTGEGLSIFFPEGSGHVPSWYSGQNYSFVNTYYQHGTQWRNFLLALPPFEILQKSIEDDWGLRITEPWIVEAQAMQPVFLDSSIEQPADVDFFKISTSPGQILYADLYGDPSNNGLSPLLSVYAEDQESVLTQKSPNGLGLASIKGLSLEDGGEYYLAVSAVGNSNPLFPAEGDSFGRYSLSFLFGEAAEVRPVLGVGSQQVSFGQVPLQTWSTATLCLTNQGGSSLDILQLELSENSPFRVPAEAILLPVTLTAGEAFDLDIGINPTQIGQRKDVLHIVSTDPQNADIEVVIRGLTPGCICNSLLLLLIR